MSRIGQAVRAANRTKRAEDDVALRAVVAAAVGLAVVGVTVTGAVPVTDGLVVLPLLAVGSWVSSRRRRADNTVVKAVLAAGALLALWRFFGDVRVSGSLDDTRQPLAQLFLAVQVLHAFDLPARRDLGFSVASSLTLVALAATATAGLGFGVLLAAYLGVAGAASAGLQRSLARERADELAAGRPVARAVDAPRAPRPVAVVPVLLAAALVFSLLPPTARTRLAGLPFGGLPGAPIGEAGVVNAELPFAGREVGDQAVTPEGTGYFGFAERVDLRTVTRPPDDPVLRVRADRPRLLRGIVFDTYDGRTWSRSSIEPGARTGPPVELVEVPRPRARPQSLTTTVELLRPTPNLFFAPADPVAVWSSGSVTQWDDGTLTTGATQDAGTVYSVVSRIDVTPLDRLRVEAGADPGPADRDRYLQLPGVLPDRVRDLAGRLTAGAPTPYAKAEAIEDWLGANTEYTLDAPPPPPGSDVVDSFLFRSRRGWCEPIAASMVVLLRAAGIPARFATGFLPGVRQPLTGRWTVRASDAHAWVEAWIPGHGWVGFDPTGSVPLALDPDPPAPKPPLLTALAWLADRLRPVAGPLAASGVGALLLAALAVVLRRRRRRPSTPFGRLLALLAARGLPVEPWRTPREVAAEARLAADLPAAALATIVAQEEALRYAPGPRDPRLQAEAERALADLVTALRR